jgi:hypothetical protein
LCVSVDDPGRETGKSRRGSAAMVTFGEMGTIHLKQRMAQFGKSPSGKILSSDLGCASRDTGEPGCESGCRRGAAGTTVFGEVMESSRWNEGIHIRKKKANTLVTVEIILFLW